LDQTTGATVWNYTYGKPLYAYCPPSVADGIVFQVAEDSWSQSYLFALNAITGQLIWKSANLGPGVGHGCNPAIADGRVYVKNGGGGTLYCFGKGPTKTALSILSSSSEALITGSVLDQSPASPNDPVAGASVSLSYAPVGGSYTDISTVTTASDGTFTYEWTLPALGFYTIMAEWDGDDSYIGSSSEEVVVDIETASSSYPTAEEIAQKVLDELPTSPSADDIAEEIINQLPAYPEGITAEEVAEKVLDKLPEYPDYPEVPEYTTIDLVIIAAVAIAIIIGLYSIVKKQK